MEGTLGSQCQVPHLVRIKNFEDFFVNSQKIVLKSFLTVVLAAWNMLCGPSQP